MNEETKEGRVGEATGDIAKEGSRLGWRWQRSRSFLGKQPAQCGVRGVKVTGEGDMGDLAFPMKKVQTRQEGQQGRHENG